MKTYNSLYQGIIYNFGKWSTSARAFDWLGRTIRKTGIKYQTGFARAKATIHMSDFPAEILKAKDVLVSLGTKKALDVLETYTDKIIWAEIECLFQQISGNNPTVALGHLSQFIEARPEVLDDGIKNLYKEIFRKTLNRLPPKKLAKILKKNISRQAISFLDVETILWNLDIENLAEVFDNTCPEDRVPIFIKRKIVARVCGFLCSFITHFDSQDGNKKEFVRNSLSGIIAFVFEHYKDRICLQTIVDPELLLPRLIDLLYSHDDKLVFDIFRAGNFPEKLVNCLDSSYLGLLWIKDDGYFSEMASKDPDQIFYTVMGLLDIFYNCCVNDPKSGLLCTQEKAGIELKRIVAEVLDKFDNVRLWELFFKLSNTPIPNIICCINPDRYVEIYNKYEKMFLAGIQNFGIN